VSLSSDSDRCRVGVPMKPISIPEPAALVVLRTSPPGDERRCSLDTLSCGCDRSRSNKRRHKRRTTAHRLVLRLLARAANSVCPRINFLPLQTLGHRSQLCQVSPPAGPALRWLQPEGLAVMCRLERGNKGFADQGRRLKVLTGL
jgi:hypothetical protein